jgi:hypothetical protein
MRWQAVLAGALASALVTAFGVGAALAEVRIESDPGGEVSPDHVCVTANAVLGFHAASYYDDASRSLVPTRQGSELVMRLYPPQIRSWIGRHGGLHPQLIMLRGRELAAFYRPCP